MKLTLDQLTTWSWRLAVIALPWQTRWLTEGIALGGIPWEQGRWSFYLAWIPLIATILLSLRVHRQHPKRISYPAFFCVAMLALIAVTSISSQATTQWLIQVFLLLAFVDSLRRLAIPKQELTVWFLMSLIPHVLLAIQQTWTQHVFAFKWLGIAAQDPATRGVSVIEVGANRVLRAYGGFPHPNILGGWMSLGILLSFRTKRGIFTLLFTLALLLSWSRSAWLATALSSLVLLFQYRASLLETWKTHRRTLLPFLFIPCLIAGFFLVYRDLVFTRIQSSTRLEQKALDERGSALATSFVAIKQHPWLGSGPGTTQLALSHVLPSGTIPIPPHIIPVMALLELGILGCFALVFLLWEKLGSYRWPYFLLVWLIPIALFDHYFWSVWAGQSLLILALYLVLDAKDETRHSMGMR